MMPDDNTLRGCRFINCHIQIRLGCFTLQRCKCKKPIPVAFQNKLHRALAQMANAIKTDQNWLRFTHRK